MVEFCTKCDKSLPLADMTIRDGAEFISPDYRCPDCGDFAAETTDQTESETLDGEIAAIPDSGFVIRKGEELPLEEEAGFAAPEPAGLEPAVPDPGPAEAEGPPPEPPPESPLEPEAPTLDLGSLDLGLGEDPSPAAGADA